MIYDHRLLEELMMRPMLGLIIFSHIMYLIALWRKDYSVVDIAWGLGFIIVIGLSFTLNRSPDLRASLVLALVSVWGMRLSLYLLVRNLKKGQEDFRYSQMREGWGQWANVQAYFKIFWLQPLILIAVSFGLMITVARPTIPLNGLDLIGVGIALLGLVIETVADEQMRRFKQNPKHQGQLIRVGLWKHARHPNYFGEIVFWWGMGFFALNSVLPWAAFNAGLLMTFLLLKFSGAPLLEARYKNHPDYEHYRKETNAFVPLQWRG